MTREAILDNHCSAVVTDIQSTTSPVTRSLGRRSVHTPDNRSSVHAPASSSYGNGSSVHAPANGSYGNGSSVHVAANGSFGNNSSSVVTRRYPVSAWTSSTQCPDPQQHDSSTIRMRSSEFELNNVTIQSQYKPSGNTALLRTSQQDDHVLLQHVSSGNTASMQKSRLDERLLGQNMSSCNTVIFRTCQPDDHLQQPDTSKLIVVESVLPSGRSVPECVVAQHTSRSNENRTSSDVKRHSRSYEFCGNRSSKLYESRNGVVSEKTMQGSVTVLCFFFFFGQLSEASRTNPISHKHRSKAERYLFQRVGIVCLGTSKSKTTRQEELWLVLFSIELVSYCLSCSQWN